MSCFSSFIPPRPAVPVLFRLVGLTQQVLCDHLSRCRVPRVVPVHVVDVIHLLTGGYLILQVRCQINICNALIAAPLAGPIAAVV